MFVAQRKLVIKEGNLDKVVDRFGKPGILKSKKDILILQ